MGILDHFKGLGFILDKLIGLVVLINGNFRILKWRYLPYIRPI